MNHVFVDDTPSPHYWAERRWRYNAWLMASIVVTVVFHTLVCAIFTERLDPPIVDENGKFLWRDNDIGGLATGLLCCFGVASLGIGNLAFALGPAIEQWVPRQSVRRYRRFAWPAGVAVSCALPLLMPVSLLIRCVFLPESIDLTPIVIQSPSTARS